MRIIEVRDGYLKLELKEKIELSALLQVRDIDKSYIAQVLNLKNTGISYIAAAKILYLYDGALKDYDRTLPDKNSEVTEFTFDIFSESLEVTKPIIAGKFLCGGFDIPFDKSSFNNKTLMSIDSPQTALTIINNLKNQFLHYGNTLVIDMAGITGETGYTAAKDFKLPLNKDSLGFIYEDCLNDATSDSKNLIKEIFTELAEYSKTVDFLPFEALKNIVDDMVNNSHIFKLLVLKNKLAKFTEKGYFASNEKDAKNIVDILSQKDVSVNLSQTEANFANRFLSVIYSIIETFKNPPQVFIIGSNNLDKRNLKRIITNTKVPATLVLRPTFKYIREIIPMFENFFVEPVYPNNEVFKQFSSLLSPADKTYYMIYGKSTGDIPLLALNTEFEAPFTEEESKEGENSSDNNAAETAEEPREEAEKEPDAELQSEESSEAELHEAEEIEEEFVAYNADETEKDSQTQAIEQKSAELIDKISEDSKSDTIEPLSGIFSDEDTESAAENLAENNEVPEDFQPVELNEPQEITEIEIPAKEEVREVEVLEADTVAAKDSVPQVNTDISSDGENQGNIPQSDDITEDLTENAPILDVPEDFHTQVNDEKIIDIPDDISDLAEPDELTELPEGEGIVEINETEEQPEELTELTEEIPEESPSELVSKNSQDESDYEESEISDEIKAEFEERLNESSDEIGLVDYDEIKEREAQTQEIEDSSESVPQDEELIPQDEELILNPTDENDDILGEIVELDEAEADDDTILVELEDDDRLAEEAALNKEITEDVDKVFTTIKDDDISDSDLDLIDELNEEENSSNEVEPQDLPESENIEELSGDYEELPLENDNSDDDGFLETLAEAADNKENEGKEILETRNSSTPIVPIYSADIPQEDIVSSDIIEQGDSVTHAKYGHGTVEKMIKYGTKTLYSINFDNVGRRLLDPTLTEIKKN